MRNCSSDEYESAPPTGTSDRGCGTVSICSSDEYEDVAPSPTSDRECAVVTTIAPVVQEYRNVTMAAVGARISVFNWKRPPVGVNVSTNTVFTFTARGIGLVRFVFFYDCADGRRAVIKDTGPGKTFERYTYDPVDGTGFVYASNNTASDTRCHVHVFIRDNGRGDSDDRAGIIVDDIGFNGTTSSNDVNDTLTTVVVDEDLAAVASPEAGVRVVSSTSLHVVPLVVGFVVGTVFLVVFLVVYFVAVDAQNKAWVQ